MNYNKRIFRAKSNAENGEVNAETRFFYFQKDNQLSGSYSGGEIVEGHLLGLVNSDGSLDFYYHHINRSGKLMAGKCRSTPSFDADGKLILHENWQWLTGDQSTGQSVIEEVIE